VAVLRRVTLTKLYRRAVRCHTQPSLKNSQLLMNQPKTYHNENKGNHFYASVL
jgi:hypothetical protein